VPSRRARKTSSHDKAGFFAVLSVAQCTLPADRLPQHCLFSDRRFRPFANLISPAGLTVVPLQSVCAGTKNAVCLISEVLRQEAGGQGAPFRWASSKQGVANRATNLAIRSETGQRMGDVVIRATALDCRRAGEYGVVRIFV
jgi:NADP-dependent 3-hydroxy acid dehydrogenase YdfG